MQRSVGQCWSGEEAGEARVAADTTRKILTSSTGFLAISSAGRRATATALQLFFNSSACLADALLVSKASCSALPPALLIIIYSAWS